MRILPQVNHWADVDPSRWPFNRGTVPAVVRAIAPPLTEHHDWNHAMGWALADHYGNWAFDWAAFPVGDYLDEYVEAHDYWAPIVRTEDEQLALVADGLLNRRDSLENLARKYARLATTMVDAAGYEAAITGLLAQDWIEEDEWSWNGHSDTGVRWLLEASGIPADRVSAAIDDVFAEQQVHQSRATAPTPSDIAERIAGRLCAPGDGPARSGRADDDWPDTWPDQWPSWRATNRRRSFTDGSPGRAR